MAITITPSTAVQAVAGVPVCFAASSVASIPQDDERYIDLPTSGDYWIYTPTNGTWEVTGTIDNPTTSLALSDPVSKNQPFWMTVENLSFDTPAAPNRAFHVQFGVVASAGGEFCWNLRKMCGNFSTEACNITASPPNTNWQADTFPTIIYLFNGVNAYEKFRVRSDGTKLHLDWFTRTAWPDVNQSPLSTQRWILSVISKNLDDFESDTFRFYLQGNQASWGGGPLRTLPGNKLHNVRTFKGSFIGDLPITWSTPLGGTLTGTGNNRCFSAPTPGTYSVCVENTVDPQVCVPILVSGLYFNPKGIACGHCVWTDEIVEFESNGGAGGTLTATGGYVIDSLTWKAPLTPGTFTLTYTVAGYSSTCDITVVERFKAENVVNNEIKGLIPGQSFRIRTNYDPPYGTVIWQNLGCQNIVSPDGTIRIPEASVDNCFGAIDCTVRVILESIQSPACPNLAFSDLPIPPVITSSVVNDPPEVPEALSFVADSTTEATLTWSGVSAAGYDVRIREAGEEYFDWEDVGNVTSFQFDSLLEGVVYYAQVRAYDGSGYRSMPSINLTVTI